MKSLNEKWHLLPLGDIHYGNPAHDNKAFRRALRRVKNHPNYLTIGMGDYVENNSAINERSLKTFDSEALAKEGKDGLLSEQIRKFHAMWEPVKDKTIGLLIGNHEDRTMNHDMFKLLFTDQLKLPYLGDLAFIQLSFVYRGKPVRDYIILATHSRFGGNMHGSVMNSAQRAVNAYDVDLVLFGHTHYCALSKMKRIQLDTSGDSPQIREKKIIICNTGSFMASHVQGFDAYTDKKIGSLRDVGTVTITFHPKTGDMFAHE